MTNPGVSAPIANDALGKKTPKRDHKFSITLLRDERTDEFGQVIPIVWGKMNIPLNKIYFKRYPDEKTAKEKFARNDHALDVVYKVEGMVLADEKEHLSEELRKLYKNHIGKVLKQEGTSIINADWRSLMSRADLRSILAPLVEQGSDLFYRLFIKTELLNYKGDGAKIVRAAIESAFRHHQIICITSPVSLFPWAFLFYDPRYDSDNHSTINPKNFWGFKHEIQETLKGTSQEIIVPPNPRLVAAICSNEDNNYHNGPDHPFTHWEKRRLLIRKPSTTELGEALENFNEDCLYFFGHANHSDPPIPAKSYLELRSQQLTITKLRQKYQKAPCFKQDIVVALFNGCKTAPLNHWDMRTMVGFLCLNNDHNSLCCVSTVDEVPAAFAGRFAKHFWNRFLLKREPIGRALLMSRRRMLARLRNPLGLLYSLFGRVDTQVQEPEEIDNG